MVLSCAVMDCMGPMRRWYFRCPQWCKEGGFMWATQHKASTNSLSGPPCNCEYEIPYPRA